MNAVLTADWPSRGILVVAVSALANGRKVRSLYQNSVQQLSPSVNILTRVRPRIVYAPAVFVGTD
jgi:hypothetical protein